MNITNDIKISRPLTIADLDKDDHVDKQVIKIPKFQENYGHTKRIKP